MTDQLSGGVVQPTDAQIALQQIADWRLPSVQIDGVTMSYESAYGSNGARDYMREIARRALSQAPLQAEPVPVVASEPSDLAPFTSPDADLNALLDAVVWFAKGPDFNNMDTGIYMMECLQTVLDRLATPQAEPAVAVQAREVLRKVVHYGNCMAAGNIMAAEAAMSSVETALASQSTPPPESAERDFDAELEAADDGPPLIGRWHHGDGVLVSGSIRIAQWDCDTNPPTEFRERVLNWMCDTLNAALAANRTAQPDGGSKA